jgi:hypothetical protein
MQVPLLIAQARKRGPIRGVWRQHIPAAISAVLQSIAPSALDRYGGVSLGLSAAYQPRLESGKRFAPFPCSMAKPTPNPTGSQAKILPGSN